MFSTKLKEKKKKKKEFLFLSDIILSSTNASNSDQSKTFSYG